MAQTKPRMSEAKVRKSLELWESRLAYRAKKHRYYHHSPKARKGRSEAERKKLAIKWHRLEDKARKMVAKRKRELKWYKDHKPKPPRKVAVDFALALSKKNIVEKPAGSNSGPYITTWQTRCANGGTWLLRQPWCGVFCWNMLNHAGVKDLTSRMASVAMIEDDAKAKRYCYAGWTTNLQQVQRGDLVVLFGRGVHVELVVKVEKNGVWTVGGNTSSDNAGSQSNGGGVFKRWRPSSTIHGFALIRYR